MPVQHEPIPQRPLGRSGVNVCALGLGGYHLGLIRSRSAAIRLTQQAVDEGITFMDNAWEYHDGESELRMGRALEGRREQVFLMSKVCTHGRDAKVANALRYAMSLPVLTTVSGIDSPAVLKQNLKVARGFRAMTAVEMNELRARCTELASDGRFEPYKVTAAHEGPVGRRQHGFDPAW